MKEVFKNKKVIIGIVATLLIAGCIGGYFIYDNYRKNEIMNKMELTFTDVKEVEYGTKDFDVKTLIKEVKETKLTKTPKLDTSKIGEVTLKFNLKKSDVIKEIEHKINIVDTKAPEIALETEFKELTVGDEYDIKSNIKSVKDVVDGDISINDKALEINKKATEEYLKLKREDITNETKVADKKVTDFLVETIKNGESGKETINLYLKNCYYIDGSVDVSKAGEYKINIIAVDKNNMKSSKEFKVTIKKKVITINNGGTSIDASGGTSQKGNQVTKKSLTDVVNSALSQVGTPYVWGGSAPGGFDCSGLIYWAFNSNGYSIPRAVGKAGYSIGNNILKAKYGDILVLKGHSMLYMGGSECVQSASNKGGVIHSVFESSINYARLVNMGDPNVSGESPILDIRRIK